MVVRRARRRGVRRAVVRMVRLLRLVGWVGLFVWGGCVWFVGIGWWRSG